MGSLNERLRTARSTVLRACRRRLHPTNTTDPAGVTSTAAPGAIDATGEAVNGFDVLDSVLRLPVSTWRYVWEGDEVRHLGPMAQDWHAAFGLGVNDRTICCTDTNGVALVAVQALHRRLADLRQEVEDLRQEMARDGRPRAGVPDSALP